MPTGLRCAAMRKSATRCAGRAGTTCSRWCRRARDLRTRPLRTRGSRVRGAGVAKRPINGPPLVVHPLNESDIWIDSNHKAAWRIISYLELKESHSICWMHHLQVSRQLEGRADAREPLWRSHEEYSSDFLHRPGTRSASPLAPARAIARDACRRAPLQGTQPR